MQVIMPNRLRPGWLITLPQGYAIAIICRLHGECDDLSKVMDLMKQSYRELVDILIMIPAAANSLAIFTAHFVLRIDFRE